MLGWYDWREDRLQNLRDAIAAGEADLELFASTSDGVAAVNDGDAFYNEDDDEKGTDTACPPLLLQIIGEAESLFRDGLISEAQARLDLYLSPKWLLEADCAKQYRAHMKAQRAVKSGKHP